MIKTLEQCCCVIFTSDFEQVCNQWDNAQVLSKVIHSNTRTAHFAQVCLIKMLTENIIHQKQPSGGVLSKRCSENMQQIYKRTPMPKCNFSYIHLDGCFWFMHFPGVFLIDFDLSFASIPHRVNCYDLVMPQTPFGGFKQSGIGRELWVLF